MPFSSQSVFSSNMLLLSHRHFHSWQQNVMTDDDACIPLSWMDIWHAQSGLQRPNATDSTHLSIHPSNPSALALTWIGSSFHLLKCRRPRRHHPVIQSFFGTHLAIRHFALLQKFPKKLGINPKGCAKHNRLLPK